MNMNGSVVVIFKKFCHSVQVSRANYSLPSLLRLATSQNHNFDILKNE